MPRRHRKRILSRVAGRNGVGPGPSIPPVANNWLTFTDDLANAFWSKQGVTVVSNQVGVFGPDGVSQTVDKIEEDVTTSFHDLFKTVSGIPNDNAPQTFTVVARKRERSKLSVSSHDKSNVSSTTRINLDAATIENLGTRHTATLVDLGQDWVWIKIVDSSFGTGASGSVGWYMHLVNPVDPTDLTYNGVLASGIELWRLEYYPNFNGVGIECPFTPNNPPSIPPGGFIGGDDPPRNGTTYTITPNANRTSAYVQADAGHPGSNNAADGSIIDASGVHFLTGTSGGRTTPMTRIGGGKVGGVIILSRYNSLIRGEVEGHFDPNDNTKCWGNLDATKDYHVYGGVTHSFGKDHLIEHFSAWNVGDMINRGLGAQFSGAEVAAGANYGTRDGFVNRYCCGTSLCDDAFENDFKDNGLLYQNFISSSVCLFSFRPGKNDYPEGQDASNKLYVLDGNICWLKKKGFADSTPKSWNETVVHPAFTPGVIRLFKGQVNSTSQPNGESLGIPVSIKNNIIRLDDDPQHHIISQLDGSTLSAWTGNYWGSLPDSKIFECSGNHLLLPNGHSGGSMSGRPGGFPITGPTIAGFTVHYGQDAKDFWNAAVNAWFATHGAFVWIPNVAEKGLFA
jgi:hypothetical protein